MLHFKLSMSDNISCLHALCLVSDTTPFLLYKVLVILVIKKKKFLSYHLLTVLLPPWSLRPAHILALHLLNFHTNVFISGLVKKTNKLVIQNSFEEERERDNESYEAHSRKQSANLNEYLKHTYNIVLILLYNIYFARNIVKCFETWFY